MENNNINISNFNDLINFIKINKKFIKKFVLLSFFITLIALAVVGAIAYFSAVGFRGAGKIKKVPRNLQKYLPDDELEHTHLDKTLSIAVVLASLLTIMIPLYYLGEPARQESFVE